MRPKIHVAPPRNWVNDPNGPILWNGQYHLYYQHNPHAPVWGDMHWGHAVSDDLATWNDLGIALAPTPGGPDADGCWSGCARIIDGVPTLFYTGLSGSGTDSRAESVCRAVAGDDELRTFVKDAANPLIPASARPADHRQHRDPFVLRDEPRDRWVLLQSTGIQTEEYTGGAVVLYDSPDTTTWTYRGVLFTLPDQTGDLDTGPVWECPAFFEIDGTWVLLVSVQLPLERSAGLCPYTIWFTGTFDGASFDVQKRGLLDHGDMFYAPAVLAHPDGRQLMWGWVQESADQSILDEIGSAGALSLPREVSVSGGEVVTRFARELEALWTEVAALPDVALHEDEVLPLGHPGLCWRLRLGVSHSPVGIRLGWDGEEELTMLSGGRTVRLLRGEHEIASAPLPSGECDLDLVVDATVLELHVAGLALTARLPYSYRPEPALLGGPRGGAARHVRLHSA